MPSVMRFAASSKEEDAIEEIYESYLMQLDLLDRIPRPARPPLCLQAFRAGRNCGASPHCSVEMFFTGLYLPGSVWPMRNCVHGPAFMLRITGDCQLNSGCSCRNFAASKFTPQGCPTRARKLMFAAILLSTTLPCTEPIGS